MKEFVGIVAALLVFVAYAQYLRDILKGKTRPHPYSWFVWGLNTVLIFILQITHGAGAGAYTTVTVAAVCFLVCFLGLYKGGRKDIKPIDTVFLVMAIVALIIWLLAHQPTVSMLLLVVIDVLAVAPSVRKAWHRPFEETLSMWSINGLRHVLSITALSSYALLNVISPISMAAINLGFSVMLIMRRRASNPTL